MVTVVKTPQGHKIIDEAITADIIDGGITAFVYSVYHQLTTGDYVYITSDIDEYNGFWYVTVIDADNFRISEYAGTSYVPYYQDAEIEYYQTQPHDWSSIFLPIVYKCTNDRWPVNTVDTARTVSTVSDDNGFTRLALSGNIRFGTANMLDFVRIYNNVDSDLNTIWQIVEVNDQDDITIDLPYDVANVFTSVTIQYYYANYQVRIKIYAGLNATHPWQAKKPFEEMADLALTPDADGNVMFSVSDYIKSKVAIKNNLTLFSLPLNLDAFTGFYIETAESYDQSDNYSLYTTDPVFDADDFEGYAIAGKLPFKNVYSGDYADYVFTDGSPALWLTNADRLLAVEGYYFDISFIKNVVGAFVVHIDKYVSDYVASNEDVVYDDYGIGVYRIPITPDAGYDSFCVRVEVDATEETIEIPPELLNLALMTNEPASGDLPNWTLGALPFILGQAQSDNLSYAMAIPISTIQINYKIRIENKALGFGQFQFETLDGAFATLDAVFINANTNGIYEGSVDLVVAGVASYLTLTYQNGFIWDMYLEELSIGEGTTEIIEVPGAVITEEICIDILDDCDATSVVIPSNVRLLEDGYYRILEDGELRLIE